MKNFTLKGRVALGLTLMLIFGVLCVSAAAQAPPPVPEDIKVYVTVMDPKTVSDVFGKRIAERFVALQVTIRNRNAQHQYLLHDVSLDLKKVFPEGYFAKRDEVACARFISECEKRNKTRIAPEECRCEERYRYELSSLELSLLRGVAERGQGQDPRNKLLRFLTAIGTVGGSLVGVAGFGPSFSDSMAVFNGPVLSAYRNAFPDYTINQMNRLSDSAYQSNTLVPRQQAKVIVAFVPQSLFLDKNQRKLLWDDPTRLFNETDELKRIDFRRTEAIATGSFVVEIENLPLSISTAQFDDSELQNFEQDKPTVKGFLMGRFSKDAKINLLNQQPEGLSIKLDGTPSGNRLNFIIQSTQPVAPGTLLTFEVANDQAVQTTTRAVLYTPDLPTITDIDKDEGSTGSEVDVEITGTNFTPGKTRVLVNGKGVRVPPDSVEVEGANKLKAKIVIEKGAALDERRITVTNPRGESQSFVRFTVKAPQ